ncbi:hypothetical protein [Nonomuraea terrae]|nr:hypothetical protein [Nonomuraea terrae]
MPAIFDDGTQRSRDQYAAVLDEAGPALDDVVELGSGASLIAAGRR